MVLVDAKYLGDLHILHKIIRQVRITLYVLVMMMILKVYTRVPPRLKAACVDLAVHGAPPHD